jgi:hypothetical protein
MQQKEKKLLFLINFLLIIIIKLRNKTKQIEIKNKIINSFNKKLFFINIKIKLSNN